MAIYSLDSKTTHNFDKNVNYTDGVEGAILK